MRRLLVPFAVAVALVGGACSSGDDGGGSTTTAPAAATGTTGTTGTTGAGTGAAPTVDVISPGAEPRTPLRLAFTPGATVTYTSSTTNDQTVNGASPGPITTTFTITTEVVGVDGGLAHITATYRDPQVEATSAATPDVVDAANRSASILDGAVADLQVDDHGIIHDAEFTVGEADGPVADSIKAALLDSVKKVGAVVPDDAVGVGAQWVQHTTTEAEGVTTAVDQTFTVVSIDATGADLSFTITGTYAGASTGTTTGSGTSRLWFDSMLADVDSTATSTLTAQGSDVGQDVTQSLHRAG